MPGFLKRCTRLGLLAVLLPLSACDVFSPDSAEEKRFDEARANWRRLGIENYSFVYQRFCECLPEAQRPTRYLVQADRVVEAYDVETGQARSFDAAHTINGIFSRIGAAFRDGAYRVTVTYDATWHYPASVYVDPDSRTADEEWQADITALTPAQ